MYQTDEVGRCLLVLREAIKEMVDDVGGENLDTHLLSHVLSFAIDVDIEAEHDCIFRGSLKHCRATHDIFLVHRANVDPRNLQLEKSTDTYRNL
jgi:hypothetical protein